MKEPIRFRLLLLVHFVLAVSCFLAFSSVAWGKESKMKDITDTVLSDKIMTKFALLVRYSELGSFLSSRGPLTLFAPTDSAFSRIPADQFNALEQPENKAVLQRIILFHVVNGKMLTDKDLAPLKTLLSCEGSPLPLRVNHAGDQIVSRAKILRADIRCANGFIHEIDTVLLPPDVSLSKLAVAAPPVTNAAPVSPPASTNDATATAPDTSTNAASDSNSTNTAPPAESTNSAPATNAASTNSPPAGG